MRVFMLVLVLCGPAFGQMGGPPAPPPPPLPEVKVAWSAGGYQLHPDPNRWMCWVNARFSAKGLTPGGHYYAQMYLRPDSALAGDYLVANLHFYADGNGEKTWSYSILCGNTVPPQPPTVCPNCESGYYVIGMVKEYGAGGTPGATVCASDLESGWTYADDECGPYWPE